MAGFVSLPPTRMSQGSRLDHTRYHLDYLIDLLSTSSMESFAVGNQNISMAAFLAGGFGTPTVQDQRPWLWVTSIVCCSYSLLAFFARLVAKWDLLGLEDLMMTGSYVGRLCIQCLGTDTDSTCRWPPLHTGGCSTTQSGTAWEVCRAELAV